MPPHGLTNPAPKTESAREARKSFYCELCGKGYARMNEFEAHEGSYDHLHTKRLKEMKQMSRDPAARSKALRAERRADEKSGLGLITIKPLSSGAATNTIEGGGPGGSGAGAGVGATPTTGMGTGSSKSKGFKKGGFRNAFGGGDAEVSSASVTATTTTTMGGSGVAGVSGAISGSGPGEETEGGGIGKRGGAAAVTVGIGFDDVDNEEEEESENDALAYAAEGGRYDPRRPTGCGEECRGRGGREVDVGGGG